LVKVLQQWKIHDAGDYMLRFHNSNDSRNNNRHK